MPLIVNGVEIENLIVINTATGEQVEIDKFQDNLGNVIFEKISLKGLILNISLTSEKYMSPTLKFEKSTDSVTTIDWGDGTSETTSTAGANAIKHTYSSLGDYDITISDSGGYIKPTEGVLGSAFNDADGAGYAASLVGVTLGTIVREIGSSAFLNSPIKPKDVICHNGIISIEEDAFSPSAGSDPQNISYMTSQDGTTKYLIEVNAFYATGNTTVDDKTILFSDYCFGLLTSDTFVIPKSVKYFGKVCMGSMTSLTSLTFNHSSVDKVVLPQAGDGSGFLYNKTAKTMTIYTDNETIKNYDYAADNVTATILHLDGSAWE